ncbi:MAG: hypothetical protein AABW79_02355 [Nanoarchaeota archaeon]
MARKTTSLQLEEEIFKKVKMFCLVNQIKLYRFVEVALNNELERLPSQFKTWDKIKPKNYGDQLQKYR